MKKLLKFIVNGVLFVVLLLGGLIYFDSKKDSAFEKDYEPFAQRYIRQYHDNTTSIGDLVDKLNEDKLDKIDADALKAIKVHLQNLGDIQKLTKVKYDGVTYSNKGNKGLFVYKAKYSGSVLLFKVEVIEKDSGPRINNFVVKEVTSDESYNGELNDDSTVRF